MKGEMTEVLIPIHTKQHESNNLSVLKAFLGLSLLIGLGFIFVRYDNKICELEFRLANLETESIRNEHNEKEIKSRLKREANPGGGHSGHETIPWVQRSGDGDPQLNQDYLALLRAQSERARSEDDQMYGQQNRQQQRVKSGGRRQRGPSAQEIHRNHEDETFFTKGQNGNIVRPSGLKEMYERLPPVSNEVSYQTPNLETRAFGPAEANVGTYAPVTHVGTGADQVRARVVRYDDSDDSKNVAVAAHYVADVSNFTTNENPRLRNSNGIFQIWRPAEWMSQKDFALDKINGAVTVAKDGIYHIYAQIHYHDVQENSFTVEINEVPLVQCTTTQESNSCFTGGIAHLKPNDKIVIKNIGIDRFSIYKPEKSFFGLMKIGDAH